MHVLEYGDMAPRGGGERYYQLFVFVESVYQTNDVTSQETVNVNVISSS